MAQEREVEKWVTMRGMRIPIYKGESQEDIIKRRQIMSNQQIAKDLNDEQKNRDNALTDDTLKLGDVSKEDPNIYKNVVKNFGEEKARYIISNVPEVTKDEMTISRQTVKEFDKYANRKNAGERHTETVYDDGGRTYKGYYGANPNKISEKITFRIEKMQNTDSKGNKVGPEVFAVSRQTGNSSPHYDANVDGYDIYPTKELAMKRLKERKNEAYRKARYYQDTGKNW